MTNQVRKITDGAMMVAIVGVLLLINRQFAGFFEEILLFVFPLPMVFYGAKYGLKDSFLVLASIVLLTVVIGTPQTLFYVASESILGMLYGAGIYEKKDSRKLVLMAMAVGVFVNIFSTVIYAKFFGYDLGEEVALYQASLTQVMNQTGMSLPSTVNLPQMLMTMLIVSVILTGIIQGYVTHVLSRLMLKRMRFPVPPATPVMHYFPPVWSGYVAILGLILYYVSINRPLENDIAQNIMQGFGICSLFYLSMYGMIAIVVYGATNAPQMRLFFGILAFFLLMTMALPIALVGFLYITTNWHQKMLEGGAHAAKNG